MRIPASTKILALSLLLALTQACSTQTAKPDAPVLDVAPMAEAAPAAPATEAPKAAAPKEKCAMHGAMNAGGQCAEGQAQGCCGQMKEGEKCPRQGKMGKKSKKGSSSKK
jgi:hypothetical protein